MGKAKLPTADDLLWYCSCRKKQGVSDTKGKSGLKGQLEKVLTSQRETIRGSVTAVDWYSKYIEICVSDDTFYKTLFVIFGVY